ncbi:MAG: hypothetical protein CVT92_13400 [Bacteroidetes bacterium HGW-Bacteroidetes-1]|nr:MAG: hypothetical protein CVT92_13400 [Bacteroidetes bacterium HGW-Bacteroidetes-1]
MFELISKVFFRQLLAILCYTIFIPISAQTLPDTIKIDSTEVLFFNRSFDSLYLGKISSVDTSLNTVSQFDVLSRSIETISTLSNAGTAYKSQLFSLPFNNGFDMEQHAFSKYIFKSNDVEYLDPFLPFTELNYMMGSKKEQQLNARFNRQMAPRLFLGMDFRLISSPGSYKSNGIENNTVYFTLRYSVKNERYGVLGNYRHSKLVIKENGGISNDEDFESNQETDRRIIDVNLTDANNTLKQSGFSLEQYFILSPPQKKLPDSVESDQRFHLGRITHQMEYLRNQLIYNEKNSLLDFYKPYDIILDSARTYDSIYQAALRNRFYWSNLSYKKHKEDIPFYIYGGVELLNALQSDSTFSRKIWQVNPFGGVQISLFRSFYVDGTVKLITGNYSAADFHFDGGIKQYLGTESRNLGSLFFRIKLMNQSPTWFQERYYSNHFRWVNDFNALKNISFKAGYNIKGITLGGNFHIIDKHIYMNSDARPKQTTGTIKVIHLFSNFHFHPGKFDIYGTFNYQISDNDTIIHLPTFSSKLRFAFTQEIFAGAATLQPGFDLNWFSSYYADAYMPALRSFYIQNEKKVGNYPYLDVYLALKVKRARIFVQYANVIGLAGNYTYYTTPHYPMRDARFYFGVSWRFYK